MSTDPLTNDELVAVIKECAGVTVAADTVSRQPDLTFADLSIDSLGVLGIITALENRYGVVLGNDAPQCDRPGQLRALVNDAITSEDADARPY